MAIIAYLCHAKIIRMLEIFAITLLIISIAVAFLSVRLFAGRRFVHTHVDGNRALNKQGIHCVQSQDRNARRPNPRRVSERRKENQTITDNEL